MELTIGSEVFRNTSGVLMVQGKEQLCLEEVVRRSAHTQAPQSEARQRLIKSEGAAVNGSVWG